MEQKPERGHERMLTKEEAQQVNKMVNDIIKILTQDGTPMKIAKSAIDKAYALFLEESKHFLNEQDASEVFGNF